MNENGRLGLGAAVTEDGKLTKPNKAAPEAPLASDGLVTWSLIGNQKQESIKWTIDEDDDIRTIEGNFGQEDKHKPVDLEDFQDGGKYRSIVKIQSRWGDEKTGKWTMGTGWLVREDIVITAGHNVFSATHKCQASRIQCWIGYRGHALTRDSSVQHRSALNVVTTESWLGQHSDRERRDLALIQVDKAFAGNLRLFRYIDTPAAKANGSIIVVGYPGDKYPEALAGETGSWMCEARQKANYDHDSSANHMIEYDMDTYGGQSGAPILFSDHNGTVVIGTHCYGATGGSVSSGSPIGGEHGNNYDEFIKLVEPSKRDEPHRLGGFQPKFANPESQLGSNYRGIIGDSSPDDFWDMLEAVLGVGLYPPSRERTTLGPVGWLMATIAGGMIGVLSETAGTTGQEGFILPKGKSKRACIHRAQLAESVLQCVIQLEPSQERERIMSSMQKVWSDHPSWLPLEPLGEEHLQAQLSPIFNDFGFRLAVSQWQRGVNVNPRAKPVDKELLKLRGHGPTVRSRRGDVLLAFLSSARTRFVHNADDMTVESRGLWLSDMLESALRAAKPIVSEAASKAVSRTVHAMGVGHRDAGLVPAQDQIDVEMDRILKRAVVAETALQALEDMEPWELRALRVVPGGTERESALDRLMTILQQMGPRATLIAESTMARLFTPIVHRLWKQSHQDDHHAVPGSAVADPDEVPGTPNENGNTPPPAHSPTVVPEPKHV
ncbi:hypothetical protein MY4824_005811 [Beauveria thailandica]